MADLKAELAVDCKDPLGEGTFYDSATNELWWISIPHPSRIHRLDVETQAHSAWEMSEMVSYAVPTAGELMLVASHGGLNSFDPASGELKRLAKLEDMKPLNRSNDACCDTKGNLWVGTMQNNIAPDQSEISIIGATGALYRVDADLNAELKVGDVGISNSCCFSPDGRTMYFCDTLTGVIWAYDLDPDSGAISNRRDFATHERGHPDGATVDADGCVWSARYDGGCVIRFTPEGKEDLIVEVPTTNITCCSFGGPRLDTLYITTARAGKDASQLEGEPEAGSLFAAVPGVTGIADVRFAGSV